jgi:hypothetical protein
MPAKLALTKRLQLHARINIQVNQHDPITYRHEDYHHELGIDFMAVPLEVACTRMKSHHVSLYIQFKRFSHCLTLQ